jgi:hypothetical protein
LADDGVDKDMEKGPEEVVVE